jgi:hypothetical protein
MTTDPKNMASASSMYDFLDDGGRKITAYNKINLREFREKMI